MINAYPLAWPTGWKRTRSNDRILGRFNKGESNYSNGRAYRTKKWLTVSDGVDRILESLGKMWVDRQDIVISTNVRVRLDGLPRSGEKEPDDPGAAVYWKASQNSPMRCMAIDRYTTVADNLAAIAATLEAMRAIERHGGAEILDRTFTGFAALPAKASQPWRDVLGLDSSEKVTVEVIESAYRANVKLCHPDIPGGDRDVFEAVVEARKNALAEAGA